VAIDWPALRAAALAAARNAYAPYSRLQVGAAGQVEGEAGGVRIVTGCNVENASYGLTLCAECGLVSALHASGGGRLVAVSVVTVKGEGEAGGGEGEAGGGAPLMPCGRCRQLLIEAGGPGLLLDAESGPREMHALLPSAFTGTDLETRRDSRA
jgi:cytidine deaminase